MVAHEKQCYFRLHKCFAAKCSWNGPAHNILEHMEVNHKERVFQGSEKVFKVKNIGNRKEMDMMYLFSCFSREFWVKFIYKEAETSFFGAVQYVGQSGVATEYSYSFEIQVADNQSSKQYRHTRVTHADVQDFEMIFRSRDCFWVPIIVAKHFAENDVLSIKLNISDMNN
jgi:Seven in absentia protein family.